MVISNKEGESKWMMDDFGMFKIKVVSDL